MKEMEDFIYLKSSVFLILCMAGNNRKDKRYLKQILKEMTCL